MEWRRGDHVVSDEPRRLDRSRIWRFLSRESYWAGGIPEATVEKALEHSLCFGLYRRGTQVGFARVVTDRATFAYLCDVFVDAEARGEGLGEWMVSCVLEHPELQGLRRICLMTRDAQGLYERFGFRPMPDPSRYLEIHRPGVYGDAGAAP
jgi:ribosomal protein S18 acetylase RimI-like enzyme